MAQNFINVTPGSGASVATKKIADLEHQRVILHEDRQLKLLSVALSTTGDYNAGYSVGAPIIFTDSFRNVGEFLVIEELSILTKESLQPELDILLFTDSLVVPGTDRTLFEFGSFDDFLKIQSKLSIVSADYVSQGDFSEATLQGLNIPVKANLAGKDLYLKLLAKNTFTASQADSLRVRLKFKMD